MALIQNGKLRLALNCLVLHGAIWSSIVKSSAVCVYVIFLHHVTIAIFVYISKVKVSLMVLHGAILRAIIRSSAIFVYVICLHHVSTALFVYISKVIVRLCATLSAAIMSSAIFVDIT